jgi:hypothetical protein
MEPQRHPEELRPCSPYTRNAWLVAKDDRYVALGAHVLLLVVCCESLPSAIGDTSTASTAGSGCVPLARRSLGVAATM